MYLISHVLLVRDKCRWGFNLLKRRGYPWLLIMANYLADESGTNYSRETVLPLSLFSLFSLSLSLSFFSIMFKQTPRWATSYPFRRDVERAKFFSKNNAMFCKRESFRVLKTQRTWFLFRRRSPELKMLLLFNYFIWVIMETTHQCADTLTLFSLSSLFFFPLPFSLSMRDVPVSMSPFITSSSSYHEPIHLAPPTISHSVHQLGFIVHHFSSVHLLSGLEGS